MKIAIVGAGAIGGYVGVKLALSGEDVTFLARGANLAAIGKSGMKLVMADGVEHVARVKATSDYSEAGAQDMVILAVKAHQLEPITTQLPKLFGPDTVIVTMQNGIPYWYFHEHGGELAGRRLLSVDPSGLIYERVPPERVVGCVVYPASDLVAPGVVRHIEGNRFPVGELDGSLSERVKRVSECFTAAGFKAPVLADIRSEMWLKLWGNLTFNPISALTRSTLADICRDPLTRELAANMMREAEVVAKKLGITFRVPLERRIAGAEQVGHHKTSMLHDVEAGRELEIDALVGSVAELGRLTQTATPYIDAVHALTKRLGREILTGGDRREPLKPEAGGSKVSRPEPSPATV